MTEGAGNVGGAGGVFNFNIEGQNVQVTEEDMYLQQAIDVMTADPKINDALSEQFGHPFNENDLQQMLRFITDPSQLKQPEFEGFESLFERIQSQVMEEMVNELGFDSDWTPNTNKVKLAVFNRYISSGEFNSSVSQLAKQLGLSEEEANQLLQLYAHPEFADSVDSDTLDALLSALGQQFAAKKGIEGDLPIDLGAFGGDAIEVGGTQTSETAVRNLIDGGKTTFDRGVELSQRDVDNLGEETPHLTSDRLSREFNAGEANALQEASRGNPWFGGNHLMVSLFENILYLFDQMQEMKLMEMEITVNTMQGIVTMADEMSQLTIASSQLEAEMYRNEGIKNLLQAAVTVVAVGIGFGAYKKARSMKNNPDSQTDNSMVDRSSAFQMGSAAMNASSQLMTSMIESGFNFEKASLTAEKGYVDAVNQFMQQVMQILQQELSSSTDAYRQLNQQLSELIQQFNKWADEHYRAHGWSGS